MSPLARTPRSARFRRRKGSPHVTHHVPVTTSLGTSNEYDEHTRPTPAYASQCDTRSFQHTQNTLTMPPNNIARFHCMSRLFAEETLKSSRTIRPNARNEKMHVPSRILQNQICRMQTAPNFRLYRLPSLHHVSIHTFSVSMFTEIWRL